MSLFSIALAVSDMRRRGCERSLLHRDLGELTSIHGCRMMQTDHPVTAPLLRASRRVSSRVPAGFPRSRHMDFTPDCPLG